MIKRKILALFSIIALNFLVGGQVFAESGQIFISKVSSKNGTEFIEIRNSGADFYLSKISIENGVRRKVIFSQNDLTISGGSAILIRQNGSGEADFYYEGNEISEKAILTLKINDEVAGGFCSASDSDCKKVGLSKNSTDIKFGKTAIHNSEAEKLGFLKNEKYEYLLIDEDRIVFEDDNSNNISGEDKTEDPSEVNDKNQTNDVNSTTDNSDNSSSDKDNNSDNTSNQNQDSTNEKTPDKSDESEKAVSICSNLKINEILANSKEQFIEIKNISDEDLDVSNCGILANKMKKLIFFGSDKIKAGGLAILSSDDGLKIFKQAKNIIKLVDSENNEYDTVEINETKADYSVIKIDEKWVQTAKITKGEENIFEEFPPCEDGLIRNENGRCIKEKNEESKFEDNTILINNFVQENIKKCDDGYFLNEKTNRCNKIKEEKTSSRIIGGSGVKLASSTPKICGEGYFLNPSTNRCNKIKTDTVAKNTPCSAGYERNPATGRCKKIVAVSDKKNEPCKEGFERNPETNRCRKIVKNEGAGEKPEESNQETKREFSGWWAILIIFLVLMAILGWEFRKTILTFISKIIRRKND